MSESKLADRLKNALLAVFLAAVGGLMLGYALPWRCVHWLSWVMLAPLFYAASRTKGIGGVALGLITAAVTGWFIGRPWNSDSQFGNLAAAFVVLGWVLGVTAAGFAFFKRRLTLLPTIAVTGFLGVSAEYVSQWLLPVNLAVVHSYTIPVLQLASITGVWGISFLVYASGVAVALTALYPRSAHVLVYMAVLVTIIYGWGLDKSTSLPPTERIRISAIQAGSLFDLAKLSEEAAAQGTQAVVWPEGSLDGLDQGVREVSERLDLLVVSGFTENRPNGRPFNSAALIDRGYYLGSARKTHLLGKEKAQFAKNKDLRVFSPRNFPTTGVAICYDTNFTGVVRGLAARGARVVFVPNSDPVTSSGALHFLHGALMPIRAAEHSIIIVRADRTGYSQIVHPSGWITSYLPIGKNGQITQEVVLGSGPTIFTRMGDWFAWLSIAVVAAVLFLMRKSKPHRDAE